MFPLLGMPTGQGAPTLGGASGALSGGAPSNIGQSMMQAIGNSNLGGFGTVGALGALAPFMMMNGSLGGPNQSPDAAPSTPSFGAPASSPSPQFDPSHWQSLIMMLMQKLGMGASGGGSSFGSLGALSGQGGVLSPLGASGIYGR